MVRVPRISTLGLGYKGRRRRRDRSGRFASALLLLHAALLGYVTPNFLRRRGPPLFCPLACRRWACQHVHLVDSGIAQNDVVDQRLELKGLLCGIPILFAFRLGPACSFHCTKGHSQHFETRERQARSHFGLKPRPQFEIFKLIPSRFLLKRFQQFVLRL